MKENTTGWKKDRGLMKFLFRKDEIADIEKKNRNMAIRRVVYCSFESRFARSGGLAAVTGKILPWLNEAAEDTKACLVTPFYPHIIDENKLRKTGKSVAVDYDRKTVNVDIYKYVSHYSEPAEGSAAEYYLKAGGFFNAENKIGDPYLYHEDDPRRNNEAIMENALFFCKAVPSALRALGIEKDIVFHLQEWQTTLIALTAKEALLNGTLASCAAVQTLHNSFDSGLSLEMLEKITPTHRIDRQRSRENPGFTALQLGLQLLDGPITTVSHHFAAELTSDILQTRHFAPHLQEIFKKNGVYGINNGMFSDFPAEFSSKESISIAEIKKVKRAKRKALLDILDRYHPRGRFGSLTYRGNPIAELPEEVPIFVMSGRLDPGQKGFDILLRAMEKFAEDEIKVVLTPMPVKDTHLDFFKETADKCKGSLTVFPMRMEKGYEELQMGATFGLMPSIYEPFGAAVEYMVNGTVTIARATGGLKDQIQHGVNGFLYREDPACYSEGGIQSFMLSGDNVGMRSDNPWVQGMTEALYRVLKGAKDIYQNQRDEYYRMIIEGFARAKKFDWRKSAREYFEVYEKVRGEKFL